MVKGRPIFSQSRKLMLTPMVDSIKPMPVGLVVVPIVVAIPPMVAA